MFMVRPYDKMTAFVSLILRCNSCNIRHASTKAFQDQAMDQHQLPTLHKNHPFVTSTIPAQPWQNPKKFRIHHFYT